MNFVFNHHQHTTIFSVEYSNYCRLNYAKFYLHHRSYRRMRVSVVAGITVEVLYEVDATELKAEDRRRRVVRSILVVAFQIAFILVLVLFLELLALVVFLVAMYTFLPNAIVPTPSRYKLTSQGVVLDERVMFPLKRGHRLRPNEGRKFVSVLHRWKGEVLRLYTPEPKRVITILDQLIPKPK